MTAAAAAAAESCGHESPWHVPMPAANDFALWTVAHAHPGEDLLEGREEARDRCTHCTDMQISRQAGGEPVK